MYDDYKQLGWWCYKPTYITIAVPILWELEIFFSAKKCSRENSAIGAMRWSPSVFQGRMDQKTPMLRKIPWKIPFSDVPIHWLKPPVASRFSGYQASANPRSYSPLSESGGLDRSGIFVPPETVSLGWRWAPLEEKLIGTEDLGQLAKKKHVWEYEC